MPDRTRASKPPRPAARKYLTVEAERIVANCYPGQVLAAVIERALRQMAIADGLLTPKTGRPRGGTPVTATPPIPDGPIDVAPAGFQPAEAQAILLRQILTEAGVELGAYDERIVAWLATWEWATFAPIASWIQRVAQADPRPRNCTTCEHHLPPMPAEEQCNPDGCGCTGYPEACDVHAAPPGAVFPISNCPSWQARTTEPT